MTDTNWHIPDPDAQPDFYDDVPGKRLIAFVIDSVLIVVLGLVAVFATGLMAIIVWPLFLLIPVIWMTIGFIYRVVTLANGSATPGMHMVAIEFRTSDGRKFDLPTAFLHTAGLTVSFAIPVLQVFSVILMATTARGQGLSDHLLGTVAINKRARF